MTPINYNSSVPACRVRVCLLFKRNIQSTTTGSIACMAKFAPTLAAFMATCASASGPLLNGSSDVERGIHDVIRRSTVGGNTGRMVIQMCRNTDDWVVTITPIFPTSEARRG